MADIEYTFENYRNQLTVYGRVGQSVQITFDVPEATTGYFAGNGVLPPGLQWESPDKIVGTLLVAGEYLPSGGNYGGWANYNTPIVDPSDGATYYGVSGTWTIDEAVESPATTSEILDLLQRLVDLNDGNGVDVSGSNPVTPDGTQYLTPANAENELAIEVDFDLITDQVLIPDVPTLPAAGVPSTATLPDWAPGTFTIGSIISVKEGDRFPLAIGFNRRGTLQEFENLTSIEIIAKEFAGEDKINLEEGDPTKMQDLNRYKVMLDLAQADLTDILDSYESPDGAYVDLMCEIRMTVDNTVSGGSSNIQTRTSHTFALRFEQNLDD